MASSSVTVRGTRVCEVGSVNVASNRGCISARASSFGEGAAIIPRDQPSHPRSSTFGQVLLLPAWTRGRKMVAVMDVYLTRARLGWRAAVVGTGIGLLLMPAAARAKP